MLISFLICSNRATGTLPKSLDCVAAQLSPELWECVLVDNGFNAEESSRLMEMTSAKFSSSNIRMIKETTPGLGYARRAGFATARGDWIVMLDDDNYLEPDFIDELCAILRKYPEASGVTSMVYPIFHSPNPEAWEVEVANRCLSVTSAALNRLEGLPKLYQKADACLAPRPPGGGMILRRAIALKWVKQAESKNTLFLERTGTSLIAAGDEEIWRTLLAEGGAVVVSNTLKIGHDLHPSRFRWSYLWRLNYWMAWSYALLDSVGSAEVPESRVIPDLLQNLRHLRLSLVASGKDERVRRWMDWAAWRGSRAGKTAALNLLLQNRTCRSEVLPNTPLDAPFDSRS